jgi:tripartite-type tricarboxylate transporter receptor subunit TctC
VVFRTLNAERKGTTMCRRRSFSLLSVLVLALVLAACSSGEPEPTEIAAGEDWPEPLTIYIPAPAGGGFDIAVRALQPALAEELGNDVVVQNLEGGGGAIAADRMLGDPADGTSMMIVSRSISSVPYTGSPELDPVTDFAPVGVTHADVSALSVPADAPYDTVDEFIQFAQDNPGAVRIATSGEGGVWHAAGLLLAEATGAEFEFIPYDGGAPAGNAVVAGEVEATTIGAPETRPFIDSGDLKMLAVMGEERSSLYPDVPTLQESGIDVTYSVWRGYVVSAETPDGIRAQLEERLHAAVESDTNRQAMEDAGFEVAWTPAEEFGQLIEEEDQLVRDLFEGEDFMVTEPERVQG